MKDRPDVYIVLTFGLGYRKEHRRIVEVVEPYPNRWTHHVLVTHEREIDTQLMEWIGESYAYAMHK